MHHLQILSPSEQGRIHIFESLILLWIVWKFGFGDTEDQKQKIYGVAYATYVEAPKQEADIDSFGSKNCGQEGHSAATLSASVGVQWTVYVTNSD